MDGIQRSRPIETVPYAVDNLRLPDGISQEQRHLKQVRALVDRRDVFFEY